MRSPLAFAWMDDASCARLDPRIADEIFYPDSGFLPPEGKRLCAGCKVGANGTGECGQFAGMKTEGGETMSMGVGFWQGKRAPMLEIDMDNILVRKRMLSDDQVKEIRRRTAAGEYHRDVAQDYPVSHAVISRISVGKAYRHVPFEAVH